MMRWLGLMALGVAACASGCGHDYHNLADQHVRQDMLTKYDKREAIPFFEHRGQLFDTGRTTTVDREIVLPLLKELQEIAATEQWAMLKPDDPDWALVVLVGLPPDSRVVDRMAQVVQAADDKFPGLIVQQWGNEWLAFDLIDQETYEHLKANDPHIDQQR